MNLKPLLPVLLALAAALPARAIELSLEENRAERGNIGYIDMGKLFKQFPETLRAKENFEEIVRQTEDQINVRKVEVLRLRGELSQLRAEREVMAKSVQTPPAPKEEKKKAAAVTPTPAPAPKPAPVSPSEKNSPAQSDIEALRASEQQAKSGLSAQDLSQLPGFGGESTGAPKPAQAQSPSPSEAPKPDSLVINIPGVSTGSVVVQPPEAAAPAPSPAPAPLGPDTAGGNPIPEGGAPAQPAPAETASGTALAELDAKIALRAKELEQKESEFKRYQAEQEKNLLDLESRKTEVLLGKIHRAVQEVARREGVSVVVDKNSILYGHNAVDLTEKVLKYLRGT